MSQYLPPLYTQPTEDGLVGLYNKNDEQIALITAEDKVVAFLICHILNQQYRQGTQRRLAMSGQNSDEAYQAGPDRPGRGTAEDLKAYFKRWTEDATAEERQDMEETYEILQNLERVRI